LNQRTVSEESKTSGRDPGRGHGHHLNVFVPAPRDLVAPLRRELEGLGAAHLRAGRAGVRFRGALEVAYRTCLWSRFASRVLLPLSSFPAASPEALYAGVHAIDWQAHVAAGGTLAVDFVASRSLLKDRRFGAQTVKDAVVDQLRARTGARPSVAQQRPDVRINTHLDRDVATIAIDLAGESLHRRGLRQRAGAAPLKENVAAAMLDYAGWPGLASAGRPLLDPMCGSATLLVEAALMAADAAPGLERPYFGLEGWLGHDRNLWQALLEEARRRRREGIARLPPISGYDADRCAVEDARANLEAAGLGEHIQVACTPIAELTPPGSGPAGLIACNPPYGKRLSSGVDLDHLYADMGRVLSERFAGWRLVLIAPPGTRTQPAGLEASSSRRLDNGPVSCRVRRFEIPVAAQRPRARHLRASSEDDAGADMFANRLRKNLRSIGRWARRESIDCYRLYDADMPEYAFALDVYAGADTWVVAQEYEAPAEIPDEQAAARRATVLSVVESLLEVPTERIVQKTRRRQRHGTQYERLGGDGALHAVRENGCRLLVNFGDRLDTGLFLDHRRIRQMVAAHSAGRHFLNLFAYTGAATVYAAAGGATATTSVDISQRYLDWLQRNLALNDFRGTQHRRIRADCLEWLERTPDDDARYGVILLNPPTFSNSKRMHGTLDVQRDHVALIRRAARRMTSDGVLLFCNHLKRFRFDRAAVEKSGLDAEDISRETVPRDFARNPRTHHCWRIRSRDA